jgi:hypothetical protein
VFSVLQQASKQARKKVRKKERKKGLGILIHPGATVCLFVCLFVAAAWPLNRLCM